MCKLNEDALEFAQKQFSRYCNVAVDGINLGLSEGIKSYLSETTVKQPPKNRPFDITQVNPGDKVGIKGAVEAPYKFVGVTSKDRIILECENGAVFPWEKENAYLPPIPNKTVKIRFYRIKDDIIPVEERGFNTCTEAGYKACSDIIEIEVKE